MNITSTIGALALLALASTATAQSISLKTISPFFSNNTGSSGGAVFFDATITAGVSIISLDTNFSGAAGLRCGIEVWTCPTSYVGNETIAGAWTQVASDNGSAVCAGRDAVTTLTLASPLVLTAGSYGICLVAVGSGHAYTNGNGANQAFNDSFISLQLGSAQNLPWSNTLYSPRTWNGALNYDPAPGLFPNFEATPTAGFAPLNVQFTDTTYTSDLAGVQSWGWDFDADGIIESTQQHPQFTYLAGTWDVALSVTDTMHQPATATKIGFIGVDVVVASFTATNTYGAAPLFVAFTDTSTGPVTLYEWDFDNDGRVDSNSPSPQHIYTLGGVFTVALKVSNATHGSTDTQVDLVVVDGIQASFTASAYTVDPGTNVLFTDTSTGPVTAWAWDLDGDGAVDTTLQNPNFTYVTPGIFSVTLTVSNASFTESTAMTIGVGAISMPAFTNTFTGLNQARGYNFRAPVAFSITGLRVPDEAGHGLQNVTVLRTDKATQGTISNFDVLFEATGVASDQVIPCAISLRANDVVIVLGTCGDGTTTMHSSYGAGGSSNVVGYPIHLGRSYYQHNLVNDPLSTSGYTVYNYPVPHTYSIGRVFTAVSNAAGLDYGEASDSGLGNGAPALTTSVLPVIGGVAELEIVSFDATAISCSVLLGVGRAALPTPFGTVNIGILVLDVSVPGFAGAGTFKLPVTIPNVTSLIGGPTNFQALVLDPSAPRLFGMSNGTEWFIGSY